MAHTPLHTVYLTALHYPVYALGLGRRIGVWFQGCSIRCDGCIARDEWEVTDTGQTTVEEVLGRIAGFSPVDGATISGGEPFDQPEALYALVLGMRGIGIDDILCYSGYEYRRLCGLFPHTLSSIDVLVDGGFVNGLNTPYAWKGSDNQEMVILSANESIISAYGQYRNETRRKIQIIEGHSGIFAAGIPTQEHAEALRNGFI
ncbi:MAG: radical SAM protein [Nitrospirae bacterium]|nr:radical SAM protein [Nitrospirota bacterium]